jgi:copper transport protein
MSSPEPLIQWPQPILEFLGFIAAFLATGAIGFRFAVLRPWLHGTASGVDEVVVARGAERRSAILGLIGSLAAMALFYADLQSEAVEKNASLGALLGSNGTPVEFGLGLLTLVGFALATSRVRLGWYLALAGVIAGALHPALSGNWVRLINPVHVLAGGMWIGTLFHVVTAGIRPTLRSGLSPERRGAFVRELVRRFSPLALASAGVLATFGVITAWRHLKTLPALWTTPYGITLSLKLLLVACVLALGAFNFRRQRPILGTEAGATSLRRSASAELAVATMVLIVTSVLVSLPAPR